MWAAHVIHHSSQHYNLSTALRQTWTGFFALGFLFSWPMFLLGFPPEMVFFCSGLNLIYQFWIHTEAIGKMPRWFEAVMNTPSHHRVHHATNPRYLDANYAGVFIIWDKMFGTFEPERDDVKIHYGLVRNLGTFNVIWAAFHEWAGIAKDVWSAPWKHKLGYMWREPGWTHDGSRDTSATIRAKWQAREAHRAAQLEAAGVLLAVATLGLVPLALGEASTVWTTIALCAFMAAYAVANVVVYTINMDFARPDSAGTDFTTLTSFALAISFVAAALALTAAVWIGYLGVLVASIVLVLVGTALGLRHQRRHGVS